MLYNITALSGTLTNPRKIFLQTPLCPTPAHGEPREEFLREHGVEEFPKGLRWFDKGRDLW